MSDPPTAGPFTVEAELREPIEPTRDIVCVAEKAARLELALADERLRVDDQPRLALGREDVAAVEVLVHKPTSATVDRAVDVEGDVEQPALERITCLRVAAWDGLGPAVGFVGEEREWMRVDDIQLQTGKQLSHDSDLINIRVP